MNKLVKVIQYFILAEGIYILYLTVLSVLRFFYPEPYFIIIHSFFGLSGITAIIISFGIRSKKSWAIILYGVFIILFILFPRIGISVLPSYNAYILLALNIVAGTYLITTQWSQWKVGGRTINSE